MKNLIFQYIWIVIIASIIIMVGIIMFPNKEDKLEYILKEVEKVQEEQKVLTEKEKELVEKAFEKEWEEVDNTKDK